VVRRTVFSIEDNGGSRSRRGGAVREGPAGAEAGTQIERDQGLAQAGITVEDGEFARPRRLSQSQETGWGISSLTGQRNSDGSAGGSTDM